MLLSLTALFLTHDPPADGQRHRPEKFLLRLGGRQAAPGRKVGQKVFELVLLLFRPPVTVRNGLRDNGRLQIAALVPKRFNRGIGLPVDKLFRRHARLQLRYGHSAEGKSESEPEAESGSLTEFFAASSTSAGSSRLSFQATSKMRFSATKLF